MMLVRLPVTQTASVHQHAIVQQRAASLLDRLQSIEKISELFHVITVDGADLRNLIHVPWCVAGRLDTLSERYLESKES